MKLYKILVCLLISVFVQSIYADEIHSGKYELNDIHSKLNPTLHADVVMPTSIAEIQKIIKEAQQKGLKISISAGKHSMGGQQFGTGTININMSSFNKILGLDEKKGIVEVESGTEWPELIKWLHNKQTGKKTIWGIRQKQTGADKLSIGGALSSNVHGRGLTMHPIIADVESFTLINDKGEIINCDRSHNAELFKLAIGGYGLFGVIATVKLRLMPVTVLQREVKIINVEEFVPLASQKIQQGYLFGDFQFDIDSNSPLFLKRGIYSFYKPVNKKIPKTANQKELSEENWTKLLTLAHTNKSKAFDIYSAFYLSTNGQLYESDTQQTGVYVNQYHNEIDKNSSEMITEVYVPRAKLAALFDQLREDFRKNNVNVIYGTVRLIKKDNESYLPWAKEDYASIIFNLHVKHTPEDIQKAAQDFRLIIDRALTNGGSYYLTYHRWASKDQVLKAYPQFIRFLQLKRKYDPSELFQSDWYRHYKKMFSKELNN